MGSLLVVIHGLAWLTLTEASATTLLPVAAASLAALVGLALAAATRPSWREFGWMIQACAIALLGLAWVATVSAA
jgi:hypothetical protein